MAAVTNDMGEEIGGRDGEASREKCGNCGDKKNGLGETRILGEVSMTGEDRIWLIEGSTILLDDAERGGGGVLKLNGGVEEEEEDSSDG